MQASAEQGAIIASLAPAAPKGLHMKKACSTDRWIDEQGVPWSIKSRVSTGR
jgi:hypothetical protein